MFTCALYYCSIVVNTNGNGLRFAGILFRHLTSNDIGILFMRIRTGPNNFHLAPIFQEHFDLLKVFLLLFGSMLVITMRDIFFLRWRFLCMLFLRLSGLIRAFMMGIFKQCIIIGIGNSNV